MPDKKKVSSTKNSVPLAIATIVVTVAMIAYIVMGSLSVLAKIAIILILLILSGDAVPAFGGFTRIFYGIYLLSTKKGIGFIDRLSNIDKKAWIALADWGLVLGFGVLSYFIFKKKISGKMMAFGIFSIIAMLAFLFPNLILAFSFINLPNVNLQGSQYQVIIPDAHSISPLFYLLSAIAIIGGFSFFIFISILYGALITLYTIGVFLYGAITSTANYVVLTSQVPGAVPLLPGITVPLVSSIAALVIVLSAHELSHGVLSRIKKVNLKSVGLLVFGVIPIGAFVEPDEKQVTKLESIEQNRIFAVGISANFLLSIFFFILLIFMISYVIPHFIANMVIVVGTTPNSSASGVIAPGSTIFKWNGYEIHNLSSFIVAAKADLPYSTVSVVTNRGSFLLKADATGKVGITVKQPVGTGIVSVLVNFLHVFIALSFLFNFAIATFNYLPIPGLDGWRIFSTLIKNKMLVKIIGRISFIAIVLNFVPWIWHL